MFYEFICIFINFKIHKNPRILYYKSCLHLFRCVRVRKLFNIFKQFANSGVALGSMDYCVDGIGTARHRRSFECSDDQYGFTLANYDSLSYSPDNRTELFNYASELFII